MVAPARGRRVGRQRDVGAEDSPQNRGMGRIGTVVRQGRPRRWRRSQAGLALILVVLYGAVLAWALAMKVLPWWVLPPLGAINLATFVAYWQDKNAGLVWWLARGHG